MSPSAVRNDHHGRRQAQPASAPARSSRKTEVTSVFANWNCREARGCCESSGESPRWSAARSPQCDTDHRAVLVSCFRFKRIARRFTEILQQNVVLRGKACFLVRAWRSRGLAWSRGASRGSGGPKCRKYQKHYGHLRRPQAAAPNKRSQNIIRCVIIIS